MSPGGHPADEDPARAPGAGPSAALYPRPGVPRRGVRGKHRGPLRPAVLPWCFRLAARTRPPARGVSPPPAAAGPGTGRPRFPSPLPLNRRASIRRASGERRGNRACFARARNPHGLAPDANSNPLNVKGRTAGLHGTSTEGRRGRGRRRACRALAPGRGPSAPGSRRFGPSALQGGSGRPAGPDPWSRWPTRSVHPPPYLRLTKLTCLAPKRGWPGVRLGPVPACSPSRGRPVLPRPAGPLVGPSPWRTGWPPRVRADPRPPQPLPDLAPRPRFPHRPPHSLVESYAAGGEGMVVKPAANLSPPTPRGPASRAWVQPG